MQLCKVLVWCLLVQLYISSSESQITSKCLAECFSMIMQAIHGKILIELFDIIAFVHLVVKTWVQWTIHSSLPKIYMTPWDFSLPLARIHPSPVDMFVKQKRNKHKICQNVLDKAYFNYNFKMAMFDILPTLPSSNKKKTELVETCVINR